MRDSVFKMPNFHTDFRNCGWQLDWSNTSAVTIHLLHATASLILYYYQETWVLMSLEKVNFSIHTATDWNHLSDNQVKSSTLPRLLVLMTSKHHLTHIHTPISSHLNWKLGPLTCEIKISNCNITKPRADVFQASFPHKLSPPAQLIYLKVAPFIILKSMSLFGVAQQFKK